MISLFWCAAFVFGSQLPLVESFARQIPGINAMRLLQKLSQSVQNDIIVPVSSAASTQSLPVSLQEHSIRIGLPLFKKASSLAVMLAVCYHDPSAAQAKETNPDAIDIRRVEQQPVGAPEPAKATIGQYKPLHRPFDSPILAPSHTPSDTFSLMHSLIYCL